MSTPNRRGRPRDTTIDAGVLAAAVEELAEHGFAGLSMEAVAARAGVAKTTVYRRWPASQDLALDAIRTLLPDEPGPPEASGREQLLWLVQQLRRKWNDPTYAAIMRRVAADGTSRPEVYRQCRERLIRPSAELMTAALRRCVDEGLVRPDADLELARRMISGPVIAAALTLHGPTGRAEVEVVVDVVLRGLAP